MARPPLAAMPMPTFPRAILIDANDGCLSIARSLGRRGVPVASLMISNNAFIGRSRFVDGTVLPPLPEGGSKWVAKLREHAREGPGVLICGSDAAVELLCSHRSEIPAELLSFESETTSHLRVMDKEQLYEGAARAGIRAPWVHELRSSADLEQIGASLDFPCVLKPALSHLARALTGRSTPVLLTDTEHLREQAGRYLDKGLTCLVVEHVPGPDTSIEGGVTVRLEDGSFPLAYTRRKLRQCPVDFGAGSVLTSYTSPEMLSFARRLLDTFGYVGVSSVEAKRHAESDELVLIEVNTRVPQSFGLGDAARVDASWRLYCALADVPLGAQPAQRDGVSVLIPQYEIRTAPILLRAGRVSWRSLLRDYMTVRDAGALSLRDPRPGFALARQLLLRRRRARSEH